MSDKNQTSSKHQKLTGEKKKQKSGWISRSSGSGKKEQKDTTIVYTWISAHLVTMNLN